MPIYRKASLDETKDAAITAPCRLKRVIATNTHSAVTYLQLFDVASGSVTVGTTPPTCSLGLNVGPNVFDFDEKFWTAVTMACTAGEANNTAPGAVSHVTLLYD